MNTNLQLIDFWQKNKPYLVWVVLFLIIILIIIATKSGLKTTKQDVDSSQNLTFTEEENIPSSNQEQVANTLNAVGDGRGEAVFVLSSKTDNIIREIQLHNPYKDSWVVAYDGYKSVSQVPVEVFRASLAAIDYDKIQVRTLDGFYPFEGAVITSGKSIIINLDF